MILTWAKLGQVATSLALVLCLFAIAQAVLSVRRASPARLTAARNAMYANFVLLSLGAATLIHAFVTSDFSVAYVAQNSNLDLPLLYRLTALWGAHEGSLLLWAWYLALFTAAALWLHWRDHPLSMPWIIVTLAAIQFGFLAFIVFLSNPYLSLTPVPANGRDLNPLLQDPGLAFHPPVLYLGYVGFAVPFAFAVASLIRGQVGLEWVTAVRRWTLFAWTALTSGIIFGGYWAYYELGWGGYWAWDPVENASLMPWLAGTALLHSMMVQEKRRMFRTWNVFLVITTFLLTLLGTFLVRSGVLTSVHAFAVDPGRGAYMLGFLFVAMVVGYGLIIWRAEMLESEGELESALSRETAILANSVLLLIVAATVLIGTLFPLAVEVFTGQKLSVGAPYFNTVVVPIMVALLFLMAFSPSIPWRGMAPARVLRHFRAPLAVAALAVTACLAIGLRAPLTVLAIAGVGFTATATLGDMRLGIAARHRSGGVSWLGAAGIVLGRSRRRFGGLIVHLGMVAIAAGMVGSGLFQSQATVEMRRGDSVAIAGYIVTLRDLENITDPNYRGRRATFSVARDGQPLFELAPEKRFYPIREMTTTEVALRQLWGGDLYAVMGDESPDGRLVARIFWNPLVSWIWAGWAIVLLGAGLSLSERTRTRRSARKPAPEPEGVPAE
ncbi:heme lyase CcmF/NrfE family subunit [Roseovarius spongiae]|uniref:Heme lyase CcmF/NrfE family subunit n=1 Tax=Roseovarius spongiae TaxID=2320272 RepID=A0A3A8ATI3_9RHOB|nr:heme lyase CcmF/NrfE family subunit [Roseovarius spongiae]RKF12854.1 heme lyase CcmF/NrfE family subunit [Roseovarius spongiae]